MADVRYCTICGRPKAIWETRFICGQMAVVLSTSNSTQPLCLVGHPTALSISSSGFPTEHGEITRVPVPQAFYDAFPQEDEG